MIIKFTLPVPDEDILLFIKKILELPPLPGYITKRGPFINKGGGDKNRIIAIYNFDESKLIEAWDIIFKHVHIFRDLPGFAFSAHRRTVFAEMKDVQPFRLKDRRLVPIAKKEM